MLPLLRWPCLLQDVPNRRLLFKQTGSSSTKGNHHPSFLLLELGRRNCRWNALVAAGNVVKQKTQQTFVNGLLGFITLGIYTPLEARVYCSHTVRVAHRYGQLYLHCSLIYSAPSVVA